MDFEFDPQKSISNKKKHDIDFLEAQLLWEDPDCLEIPAKTKDEPRIILIGKIQETYWTVVFTYRKLQLRIISVRRSRDKEIQFYEGK